ncbi:Fosmidomycin resistance protein [Variovorax sp. SRS16]|uniref:MFS transporter n=1 Tax=Variovorax sp. SRS16 TaxID=282217 RepID=UPI0013184176|nr:MFS transporter [Variovorax sp. SRS16]VTU12889.1 Fosmidomycin resistance protein [Variovorax sp. SRS16]
MTDRPSASFGVLGAISASHMINDMMQSLILAIYPILKGDFHLSFGQIGLITLTYQLTASLFQPLVGLYTDRRSTPYSLPVGMSFTLIGLILLAFAPSFAIVLLAAAFVGTGSSIFHPESSRVARMASGGRHGLAQSLFQVGGNTGSALGPLVAAAIIVPFGQRSVAWFGLAALVGILLLTQVSKWYAVQQAAAKARPAQRAAVPPLPRGKVIGAIGVLLLLIFSKYFYIAGISSFYTFYLMDKFGVSVQSAQVYLFVFLFASALGTLVGGPVGDRIGRKPVIWASILGVAPFALLLPHADLFWTTTLTIIIGLILSSAFSAILVYAQELMPGKVGMVSGLFFGFAFGMGGLGAALLGLLADHTSIDFVYRVIAYLPLLGIVAALLPNVERPRRFATA